jgi:low temperature requirement protein LtrA
VANSGRRQHDEGEEARAAFIELFFDLVFVVVITELSALLFGDLSLVGAGKTAFLLLIAWWAWVYTTWMTNWYDPDTPVMRAALMVGMLASMLGTIAIPDAFGDRALLLVIGYVGIQTARNLFVVLATERDDPLYLPVLRILIWNAWVGAIWLTGALVDADARIAVWLLALVADYAGPIAGHWTPGLGRSRPQDWEIEPSHFVERIELFLLIALGESITAVGLTASSLELSASRIAAVTVALGVTAALWWLYFAYHAERTLSRLKEAADERGRMARDLTYLHIPLVAGILVSAVGNAIVIAHPGETPRGASLIALGAGPVIYLLGSVVFKLRVIHHGSRRRLVAALAVAVATLVGTQLPALATWAIVLGILASVAAVETAGRASVRFRRAQAR